MSTLMELDDRPICLPTINSKIHFPKINTSFSSPRVRKSIDNSRHVSGTENSTNESCFHQISNSSNGIFGSNNDINRNCMKPYKSDKESYSASSVFESNALLRLPNIDRSKCNSISRIANEIDEHGDTSSRVNSSVGHSYLDQSPRYLSKSDCSKTFQKEEETIIYHTENLPCSSPARNSYTNVSLLSRPKGNVHVRLPRIIEHQNGHDNLTQRSHQETGSISASIKPAISGLCGQNMTVMGNKSKLSPRTEPIDLQRSGQHTSALLLPISTTLAYNNRGKVKRKRKHKIPES